MPSREELVDRLVIQLAGVFRERDPLDPRTRNHIEDAVSRIRGLTDGLVSKPPPWPDAPRSATFSEADGEEIVVRVLERLK